MIRKLLIEDLADYLRLFRELWPNASINSDDVQSVLEHYTKNEDYEIYCYIEKIIIGIIAISKRWTFFHGGKVAIIEDLIVKEQFRNKGIGKKLVEFVEQKLKKEGIKVIELSSDFHRTQAHQFWEKMGYAKLAYQFRRSLIHE
ncbi:MAG: GNAT family N-acetyltransferase [Candidatus Jordarchaeum sp.]|uniref:GNAT family N-acetyltransferase n=1 Tax=Candidatus Jordarchaeum sp. TaxID=2823881 RepID=UPI00404B16E9